MSRHHEDDWSMRAACREAEDPEAFYARTCDMTEIEDTKERKEAWDRKMAYAKSFCGRCEVRADCLRDAFRRGPVDGVAGGLTEREQRALFRAERERRGLPEPEPKKNGKADREAADAA